MIPEPLTQEEIDGLSPGVKDLVIWLNELGYDTCDSGDGSNYEDGMGCAVPYPMIGITCQPADMIHQVDVLHDELVHRGVVFDGGEDAPAIQANYDAHTKTAAIIIINVLSKDVRL